MVEILVVIALIHGHCLWVYLTDSWSNVENNHLLGKSVEHIKLIVLFLFQRLTISLTFPQIIKCMITLTMTVPKPLITNTKTMMNTESNHRTNDSGTDFGLCIDHIGNHGHQYARSWTSIVF